MTIDDITENFALLDDWDDRYRYVIELGRSLPPCPEEARTENNTVQGCASQVWLIARTTSGRATANCIGRAPSYPGHRQCGRAPD